MPPRASQQAQAATMTEIDKKATTSIKMTVGGSAKTGHNIQLEQESAIRDVFGTDDDQLANSLLGHCLKPLSTHEADGDNPNADERTFMLAIINDLKPNDAVERMLAVQMATTHVATIRAGNWLSRAETIPQGQAHSTAYSKLARTFTAQVEALRKHRTGGKQTVTVQHVNVSDGGQAIVGNVQTGG
jgi:hypothetical protein